MRQTSTVKSEKKAAARINFYTEKENAAFIKMNSAAKRVKIAKDVLIQMKDKRINAEHGVYISELDGPRREILVRTKDKEKEVSAIFARVKSCNACALGSLFICTLDRADRLKVKDLMDTSPNYLDEKEDRAITQFTGQRGMRSYLSRYFDIDQLGLIEASFEGHNMYNNGIHRDADLCLSRIMNNIIRNKGSFLVDDQADKDSLVAYVLQSPGRY